MPGLKRLPGDMTAAEFRAALLERMDSKILASPPRSAETVSVRTLRGLEKRRWKYIFACGMTESGLSAAPPPPPMPDKNVLAALGLETDGDRAARMSAALLRALSFAETRLIMSFSLRGADGGGALPCRELQRLEDALSTKDKNGNIETKFRRTPRSSLTEFWTAAHDGSEWLPDIPDRVITDGDAELCNLLRGMESAEPYYKNVREWRDPENWREDSPPGRGKVNFGETQARVLSPSKLDSFGGCPYRYFAENVLGLSGPEDADLSPDAASAGAAVHSAMERTMRALAGDSAAFTDPEKFDINSEKFAGLAEESLRDEFDKLIKRSAGLSESAAKALAEKWAVKLRSFSTELFRMKLDRVLCRGKSALESIRQRTGPEDALRRRKGGPTKKERALDLMKKVEKGYIPSESEYEDLDLKGPFAALAAYLEKWRRNFRPALFEWRFGGGKEPFELDAGGEKIKVSGVIDRIDRGEENGRIALRVADYKSGKDQDFKKKTESGAKLQVPLYALIIDEALKREETAPGALRDFRGGRLAEAALFSLRDDKPFAGMDCGKDNMALFRKWLRLAARHIREGRLGPAPKDNCPLLNHIGYCKLGALCMADTAPVRRFEYSDLRPPDGGITAETGGMEDGQNE
jgi:RecB family exonuclease